MADIKQTTIFDSEEFNEAFGVGTETLNIFEAVLEAFEDKYVGTKTSIRLTSGTGTGALVVLENEYNVKLPEAYKGYRVLNECSN